MGVRYGRHFGPISDARRWLADRAAERRLRRRVEALPAAANRDEEIAAVLALGPAGMRALRHGLTSTPQVACVAAIALDDAGERDAVARVLTRCYQEEWIFREKFRGGAEITAAVFAIGPHRLRRSVADALQAVTVSFEPMKAIEHLEVAVCGLRLLNLWTGTSAPLAFWTGALAFGTRQLGRLPRDAYRLPAVHLADTVRAVALRGLLAQYRADCFRVFLNALSNPDESVGRTAIRGLVQLRDFRALPILGRIAFGPEIPLAERARQAIEEIGGAGAEPLVLVRPVREIPQDELLLPLATSACPAIDPGLLRACVPPSASLPGDVRRPRK